MVPLQWTMETAHPVEDLLGTQPDPRNRRGVGHSLTSLLMAAVAAVLAGATSFTAVGEWVADAPPQVLAALGVRCDPLARRFVPPDEATIRRVLEAADADALDAAVGSWLGARLHAAGQAAGHGRRRRRAVAVDGKANEITWPSQTVKLSGVACARSGDPRGHQGLEGIGPQAIGTAGEVPPLEVCTCGVVHDLQPAPADQRLDLGCRPAGLKRLAGRSRDRRVDTGEFRPRVVERAVLGPVGEHHL